MTIRRRDEGAVALIVAAFALVALLLLAFVVDRGMIFYSQSRLQSAVDAAALSGAQELCRGASGDPDGVARTYLSENLPESWNPSVQVNLPGELRNNAYFINVQASNDMQSFFGGFTGVARVAVAAQATSSSSCRGKKGFAIFANTTLDFNGGIEVYGGIYGGSSILTSGAGTNMYVYSAPKTSPPTPGAIVSGGPIGNFSAGTPEHVATTITPQQYAQQIGIIDDITNSKNAGTYAMPVVGGKCQIRDSTLTIAAMLTARALTCAGQAVVTGPLTTGAMHLIESESLVLDGSQLGTTAAPLLFHTEGTVDLNKDMALFGTVYAPNADVTFNGGPHLNVAYGELILAFFRVNGTSGYVNLDTSNSPYGTPVWTLTQ